MSSEHTPLLSGSVNGPSSTTLPSLATLKSRVASSTPSHSQRLRIADALGALSAGKLPSQSQLSKIYDLVLESDVLKATGGLNSRTARLGPQGQEVVDKFKGVIGATKDWGEEKNRDDLLQNLFYNVETASVDIDINAPTSSTPSKSELKRDADRAIDAFRTITSLLVTNENFRSLVSSIVILLRDILADSATAIADTAAQAADATRPSEDERKEGVDFKKANQGAKKVAKGMKSGKIQGQAREALWGEIEDVKQYFDEKLPDGDEAKDQLIERLKQVVTQAQSDPQYRRAIITLVNLIKKYAQKVGDAIEETKEKSDIDDDDARVQQAASDLKEFIERISGKSLDDVFKAVQKAAKDVKDNEKLSALFDDLDKFLDRLLYQPGYVVSQRAYRKATSLYDDAQSLLAENEEWKKDAADLQRQIEGVVNGIKNDKPTNRVVDSIEGLAQAVGKAGKVGLGSLKFQGSGLYRDLVDVILPRMIGLIKEIPVPRIEYKSEDIDLVIDDFNLESASFIPDSIQLVGHNDFRFTQGYAAYASEYDASLRLKVEGFHFSASNISFWVNKKTGFFSFEDSGILEFQFGPQGISFDVTLENADEDDTETFFTVKEVKVTIHHFEFNITKNEKWLASWFFKPVLQAFIQRNLVHALESQIAEYLRVADFKLFAVQQRAIAATNAKPGSPVDWVRAVFSDSVFGGSTFSSTFKSGSKGVVKYGRRGEYLLHIGVDGELFPDQPPERVANPNRRRLRAEAKQARGATSTGASIAGQAGRAVNKAEEEMEQLSERAKEKKRREEKKEGWRSEAFDL